MKKEERNNLLLRNRWIVGVTAALALAAIIFAAVYTNDARDRFNDANRNLREQVAERGMMDREVLEVLDGPASVFHSVNNLLFQAVLVSSQLIFFIILFSFPIWTGRDGEGKRTAEPASDGNADNSPGVERTQ